MALLSIAYWPLIQKAAGSPIAHAVQGSTTSSAAVKARANHNYAALNDLAGGVLGYLRMSIRDATGSASVFATGAHEYMTFFCDLDLYIDTLPSSLREEILCVSGSAENTGFDDGAICSLSISSAGRIGFRDGADVLGGHSNTESGDVGSAAVNAQTDNTLSAGTWYRVQFSFDRTALTMALNVYNQAGTLVASCTSSSLVLGGAANDVAYFHVGKRVDRNNKAIKVYYGDCFIDSTTFQSVNTRSWLKEARADSTSNTAWSMGAGASKIAGVDGHISNGDTSYIKTATQNDVYTATLKSSSSIGITGNIIGVQPFIGCHTSSGTITGQTRLKDGGTNSDTTARTYSAIVDNELGGKLYLTAPSTSGTWSYTLLDAIEVGPKRAGAADGQDLRCTILGAVVVTDGASTPVPSPGASNTEYRYLLLGFP